MDETVQEVMDALDRERRLRRRGWTVAVIAVVLVWAVPVFSQTMVPYVFSPNTPARASEINANFAALASVIDTNQAASDARLDALETRDDFVPAGTIAFFAQSACPAGWDDYAGAHGRYIVAVSGDAPDAPSVGDTVGAPMTDLENRSHTHTIAHRHEWAYQDVGQHQWWTYGSDIAGTSRVLLYDHGDGVNGEGSGLYPLATRRNGPMYTGDPSASASGSATTSAVAPYIQLLVCQKI